MIKFVYFLYVLLGFVSSANALSMQTTETIQLETTQQEFTAGETITLTFSGSQDASVKLYCSNSYGTTLIHPNVKNQQLHYTLPASISQKIGAVHWKLLANTSSLSGTLKILPQNTPVSLETYIGPPSIEAGKTDYTMLVVIPTDALDNPLKENTNVTVKRQFLQNEQQETIQTQNMIAYQNIYAPTQSGRMLLATECAAVNSKEFTVEIMPSIATDFQIFAKRAHEYADGNQVTTFTTTVLKDKNENVVSDGTFVEFIIENADGNLLKTSGMTIDGIATAHMLHPDHEETWQVRAFVHGISESNTISLNYKKVMNDFTVAFSQNHRTIDVGPLRSFMKQHIPDGLQVILDIFQNGKKVQTILRESRDGFVHFELDPNIFHNGMYDLEITAAGVTKTFQAKKLW